jgi:P27 family predicted phage terminase small subunit
MRKYPETIDEWKRAIRKACRANGTYQKTDEMVITTLAEIMAKRSLAEREFQEGGGHTVIVHVNKAKQTNVVRNPILTTWIDLTDKARGYWNELGLSPSARKRITGENQVGTQSNALAEALKDL